MENGCGGGIETQWWWWWAMASMAKFGWGISAYKRGFAGDSRLMPLKAFAVASLFVGSAASASIASLQASGIHKVQDLIELGANVRTGLGVPPRVAKEYVACSLLSSVYFFLESQKITFVQSLIVVYHVFFLLEKLMIYEKGHRESWRCVQFRVLCFVMLECKL